MENSEHIINEVQASPKLQKKAKKILKDFTPKPILVDKSKLYNLAKLCQFAFGALGVALAVYMFQQIFFDAFSNILASFLAAISFLGVWEYGKHVLLASVLREKYVYKRTNRAFLMLNIVMIGCSMWWSVQGIAKFNNESVAVKPKTISLDSLRKAQRTEIENIKQASLLLQKSTESKFNSKISRVEKATKEHFNSVKFRGRIDIHNPANRAIAKNSSIRVKNLESAQTKEVEKIHNERKEEIMAANKRHKAEMSEAKESNAKEVIRANDKNQNRHLNLIWLAFIGDLACALAIWYKVFHKYKGINEIIKAEKETGIKIISSDANQSNSKKPNPKKVNTPAQLPEHIHLTKRELKIYNLYKSSNFSLTKNQMHKSTKISRSTIDSMFKKTGLPYHRAQPKKVSNFPKEKSVQPVVRKMYS